MGSACARRTTTSKGAVVAAGDGANFLEKKIKGEEGNALKKKKVVHRRIQYIFVVLFVIIEHKSQLKEKF